MSRPLNDSDPKKWEYAFHCYVKHTLFEKYFEAWSKILGKTFALIGYFDGFAGRGEYIEGEYGSPLLALKTLTNNEKHYIKCLCVFVEKDPTNYQQLTNLLDEKKAEFSSKISIHHHNNEFTDVIPQYLKSMNKIPFFVFLDPFGFKGVPFSAVKEILIRPRNEVFITLMTRDINRFLKSEDHQNALSELLGGSEHLNGISSQEEAANRYAKRLKEYADHVIHYQVGADNKRENIYYLIHASNHFKGFKIMKDIMFNQGKKGQFAFRGIKDLQTSSLLDFVEPNREISYMKDFLLRHFRGRTVTFEEMLEETYALTNYIEKHYRTACKELEKEKKITIERISSSTKRGGLKEKDEITFPKRIQSKLF
ncbi:MAG: three-Cys-motif partner protein TcmP [Candidatus Hermodarchaeota archaeon]